MQAIDWNKGWEFSRLEETDRAVAVELPHDAMLDEPRGAHCPSGVNACWFEGHDYCYRKTFTAPESWLEQEVFWEFEGVYHNAEVWLNDEMIASWRYGYTRFFAPAGKALRTGENTLKVIARNADQPNSRWYSGAGIYRPVWLHIAPRDHLKMDGTRIRTLSLDPAVVEVSVEATAPGHLELELPGVQKALDTDASGKAVVRVTLPNVQPWSCETPQTYICTVHYRSADGTCEDENQTTFGVRTIAWGADKGLLLNGKRIILRGACIHHDNGILGAACWDDAVERKVRLLQKAGYNAIRSAHNPCSKALLDACDRLGMLVMDEFVDCWYIHKTVNDYVNDFAAWWKKDLDAMVAKDYNHPCVILYSTGNEVSETAQPRGIVLTGQLTKYLHHLDATRPVTCGVNIFFNFLSSLGFGVYSDEKAKKELESAGKKKKAVGSEFYNDLAGLLGDKTMKIGATLHGCDVKTRGAYAQMDFAGYNYGILRYDHDLKKYPNRLILGTETFCNDAYRFWEQAKTEKRILGDFVWAGMDYLGEVGIGSWEYAEYAPDPEHGPGWMTAGSGRIDLIGSELAEADYTRVAFELEKGPILAVRPLGHKGKHSPSAWKMTNARRSWSWRGCEGEQATVEVYARAASVELQLNGRSVGRKNFRNDCQVKFRVPYENGTLTAIAYDAAGQEIGRDTLRTAAVSTELCCEPEAPAVEAGHLAFIRLRYTDAVGIPKPMERHRIAVEVTGGTLLALGNACPYNADGYHNQDTDTYYGEALAIVLADGSAPVTVRAADGTRTADCSIALKGEPRHV